MSKKSRRATKQAGQANHDEFAGLKRKLRQFPEGDRPVVVAPAGEVKMSDVLTDFVAPYESSAGTGDGYRVLLTMGMLAWNASFLPSHEQEKMVNELLANALPTATYQERLELKRVVHALIDRRQSAFAQHKRLILSFDWKDTGDGYHLSVASTLDEPPLRKPGE
jgi:hypothetical protein